MSLSNKKYKEEELLCTSPPDDSHYAERILQVHNYSCKYKSCRQPTAESWCSATSLEVSDFIGGNNNIHKSSLDLLLCAYSVTREKTHFIHTLIHWCKSILNNLNGLLVEESNEIESQEELWKVNTCWSHTPTVSPTSFHMFVTKGDIEREV